MDESYLTASTRCGKSVIIYSIITIWIHVKGGNYFYQIYFTDLEICINILCNLIKD
jgi:hypothetical protein